MTALRLVAFAVVALVAAVGAFLAGRISAPVSGGVVSGDLAVARLEGAVSQLQETAGTLRDKTVLLRDLEQAHATVAELRRQLAEAQAQAKALPPVAVPPAGMVLDTPAGSAVTPSPAAIGAAPAPAGPSVEQVVITTTGRTLHLLPSGATVGIRRLTADGALIGWRGGDQFLSLNERLNIGQDCSLTILSSDGTTARFNYLCAAPGAGIVLR